MKKSTSRCTEAYENVYGMPPADRADLQKFRERLDFVVQKHVSEQNKNMVSDWLDGKDLGKDTNQSVENIVRGITRAGFIQPLFTAEDPSAVYPLTDIRSTALPIRSMNELLRSGIETVGGALAYANSGELDRNHFLTDEQKETIASIVTQQAEEYGITELPFYSVNGNELPANDIRNINLSVRNKNILLREGVDTVEKAVAYINGDSLQSLHGISPKTAETMATQIKDYAEEHGIQTEPQAKDGKERADDAVIRQSAITEPDKRLILEFAEGEECSVEDILADDAQAKYAPDERSLAKGLDSVEIKMDEEEFDER